MFKLRIRPVAVAAVVTAIGAVSILSQRTPNRPAFVFTSNHDPIPAHTVEYKETVWTTGQQPGVSQLLTRAVKGDGSTVEVSKIYNPKTGAYKYTKRILMGVGGIYAEASPDISLISSLKHEKLDYKRLTLFGDASKNCTELLSKGHVGDYVSSETMLGYQVLKIKTQEDSSSVAHEWRAPQFGCTVLRRLREFKSPDGSVLDTSLLEAVSVKPGEPSQEFFTFPRSQFELVSPKDFQDRLHSHITGTNVEDHGVQPQSLDQLEQIYHGTAQRPAAKYDPRS